MSRKRAKNTKSDCGECRYDYVKISYGSVEKKFCGSDLPGSFISSENTMIVNFVCDGSIQFTGFSATLEVVDGGPGIGDLTGESSGETPDTMSIFFCTLSVSNLTSVSGEP